MPKTMLSEHFSLEELTRSESAQRRGLDNTPPADVLDNLKRLAAKLEEIRRVIGTPIVVSSGYRSPAVNSLVGGTSNSAHLFGLAADIIPAVGDYKTLAAKIASSSIQFDQLILEYGWVHIAIPAVGKTCRYSLLTKSSAAAPYVTGIA